VAVLEGMKKQSCTNQKSKNEVVSRHRQQFNEFDADMDEKNTII
jgi:hypothetical protein